MNRRKRDNNRKRGRCDICRKRKTVDKVVRVGGGVESMMASAYFWICEPCFDLAWMHK